VLFALARLGLRRQETVWNLQQKKGRAKKTPPVRLCL
jgi:hypothetical protein